MKSLLPIFLFLFSVVITNCGKEPEKIDPVSSFKEYIAKHIDGYRFNKRERTTLVKGGWIKERFHPLNNYTIDVNSTNSLVTPYSGICEFFLIREFTDFHKSEVEASSDSNYIKSRKILHKHTYGFQENRWVNLSREHLSATLNEWSDCDETLKWDNTIEKDLNGCWEKE